MWYRHPWTPAPGTSPCPCPDATCLGVWHPFHPESLGQPLASILSPVPGHTERSAPLTVSHLNAPLTASTGTSIHPTQASTTPPQTQEAHPPSKGSPFPERCRHVTVGSGLPKARHMRVTLLPSFTVMSDEMLTIWGGTARHKGHQRHHQHISLPGPAGRPQP